eukprot:scaffold213816_cov21-Prasinocladus_malaysianus.AAC.1
MEPSMEWSFDSLNSFNGREIGPEIVCQLERCHFDRNWDIGFRHSDLCLPSLALTKDWIVFMTSSVPLTGEHLVVRPLVSLSQRHAAHCQTDGLQGTM